MKICSNIPGPVVGYLRRKFRINYFVETGTAHGDTAELAAVIFDQVFTCEIDPALVEKATKRLAAYQNVLIYQMESPAFIREVRPMVNQPAMYWLDAHWCGGPVKPDVECPLLDELEAMDTLYNHSVLLIDDVGLMVSPPPPPHDPAQWPNIDQVYAALDAWGEDLDHYIEHGHNSDVLVVTPKR
jgi:hypothetical protein